MNVGFVFVGLVGRNDVGNKSHYILKAKSMHEDLKKLLKSRRGIRSVGPKDGINLRRVCSFAEQIVGIWYGMVGMCVGHAARVWCSGRKKIGLIASAVVALHFALDVMEGSIR